MFNAVKNLFVTLLTAIAAMPAVAQENTYMGKASTGEAVYYHGAVAQCGDLPRTDSCWKNPMISYTIGKDKVAALANCARGVFSEVWIGDRLVAKNMKPQSEAIRLVLKTGCNSVR